MKAITLALFMAVLVFSSCSETKETSESTTGGIKEDNQKTEQQEIFSKEELTMKEKAGEESVKEKVSTDKSEDKTKQLKVKDSKLESASFTAASMHCSGCEQTITGTVGKLDGVQSVTANFDSKQVQVTFISDKISRDDIAKAITDSGFECKVNN